MEVIKMHEMEGKANKRGVLAKQLIKHEHVQVMNLNLKSGDTVPEHSVPVDVFFYVVAGKGTIKIGEEESVVERDDIVVCPRETTMALRADQNESFSVLNVKTPSL